MPATDKKFFSVQHTNGKHGARTGRLTTSHGYADTPCFLPIATHGTLRALSFEQAAECGTRIVMANAWHIFCNTGAEILNEAGGVHKYMGWPGILFTDSGGYQVFSLKDTSKIHKDGVSFDEDEEALTPERAVDIQKHLGSDIMIALDDCAPFPCSYSRALKAVNRTTSWARRCMKAHQEIPARYDHKQYLYGIVQGSTFKRLRKQSVEEVAALDFDGYGIGGLSIGMERSAIRDMTALTCELLPADKPRHLLGVGLPGQILQGIADGSDTFDCVLPIRKAQRGIVHTSYGEVRYKHQQRKGHGDLPLDPDCQCPTCQNFTREQLRALFKSDKPLAGEHAAIHNLFFYHHVMAEARQSIRENRFDAYMNGFLEKWDRGGP